MEVGTPCVCFWGLCRVLKKLSSRVLSRNMGTSPRLYAKLRVSVHACMLPWGRAPRIVSGVCEPRKGNCTAPAPVGPQVSVMSCCYLWGSGLSVGTSQPWFPPGPPLCPQIAVPALTLPVLVVHLLLIRVLESLAVAAVPVEDARSSARVHASPDPPGPHSGRTPLPCRAAPDTPGPAPAAGSPHPQALSSAELGCP